MYDYPSIYFTRLNDYDTNTPEYNLVQGALYDWLEADVRADTVDSNQVARLLNRGKVGEAEEKVEELLEA